MEAAQAVFVALTYALEKYHHDFARTFVAAFEDGFEKYVDNNPGAIPPNDVRTLDLSLESGKKHLGLTLKDEK